MCNLPAMFGGCSHCGSRHIAYLICQVTLQHYVIKGSSDYTEGSSLFHEINLPSLAAIGFVVVDI